MECCFSVMVIVLIVWVSLSLLVCLACLRAAARPQPSLESPLDTDLPEPSSVLSARPELKQHPATVERNEGALAPCSWP